VAVKKIVVLGGGASSLAAVWKLTGEPNWQQKYDVTVYSLGFRLGGKGATGRDATRGYRIQEHGLHLWFGFYENAHGMLRSVLKELDRPATSPIRSWEQAMQPHNQFAMENHFNGGWHPWNLLLPSNDGLPGDGSPFPTPWEAFEDAVEVLYRVWAGYFPHEAAHTDGVVNAVVNAIAAIGKLDLAALIAPLNTQAAHGALAAARVLVKVASKAGPLTAVLKTALIDAVKLARRLIWHHLENQVGADLLAYRTWITCDALASILIGVLADDVLEKGFDHLNDQNFNDWVKGHGASQLTLDSCLIQSAYDSSFAFFRRADNPDFEAGTVLRGAVRMFLMFKGSVVYRFAGGCGDTVFAPLYELLRRRGVKFQFFHEVTGIVTPAAGAMEVTEVQLARQADVKNGVPYEPLIDVNGLACWPSTPLYAQLVQGAQLQAQNVDLESHWTPWAPVGHVTLKKGIDFDDVICGLSLEPLKLVAPSLVARSAKFGAMVNRLKTTRTQAFQLWLLPELAQLGWTLGSSLMSTFGEPLDTWADLSLTLPSEKWPANQQPKTAAYFCGAMTEGPDHLPPESDHGFPAIQAAQARQDALDFINDRLWALWPSAFSPAPAHTMKWDLLADVNGGVGPARFEQQFWRANCDPSERYVLSVTGTSKYRVRCDQTGFTNFYPVGDYTQCGINAGSMEAAFISGLQAARALSGGHQPIPGEGGGFD